jgi:hypothetical protein
MLDSFEHHYTYSINETVFMGYGKNLSKKTRKSKIVYGYDKV